MSRRGDRVLPWREREDAPDVKRLARLIARLPVDARLAVEALVNELIPCLDDGGA